MIIIIVLTCVDNMARSCGIFCLAPYVQRVALSDFSFRPNGGWEAFSVRLGHVIFVNFLTCACKKPYFIFL